MELDGEDEPFNDKDKPFDKRMGLVVTHDACYCGDGHSGLGDGPRHGLSKSSLFWHRRYRLCQWRSTPAIVIDLQRS
jgi:hypothetical protein